MDDAWSQTSRESPARRNFSIAMMYIDFLYAASDGAVWSNKKNPSWCDVWRWYDAIHIRRVFFLRMFSLMEMPTKQTYSKNDMSLLPDTSILVEVNTLRRTKKTYIITCTNPSTVQSKDHWDWNVVFSWFLPQNHWSSNLFVTRVLETAAKAMFSSRSEKSRWWTNKHRKFCHLQMEKQIQALFIVFLGVRFRLSFAGKIHPMEETDGLPRCEMRMMQMAGTHDEGWRVIYEYMYIIYIYIYIT